MMDKEYHKSHAFSSKHMVDSNRKMTRIAKPVFFFMMFKNT